MLLTEQVKCDIKSHAKQEAPRECCGFILNEQRIYKAKNISTEIGKFSVNPEDFLSASKLGDILAVYHSHPKEEESRFSEYDKFNSVLHNYIYILYSLRDNSFSRFDPSASNFNEYIGKTFKIGESDCYTLMRDFYKNELGISLNNYHRDTNWQSYLDKLFDSNFEKEGFIEVSDLRQYDCILTKSRKNINSNHIAIYLGGGLILHQPPNSYSRIEEYTDKHKKITNKIIRHYEVN